MHFSIVENASFVASALQWSAIVAAVALVIGLYQESEEFRWRRAQLTSRFIEQWTEKTRPLRKRFEAGDDNSPWFTKEFAPLPDEEAKRFARATEESDPKLSQFQDDVIAFMNWLEDMASLYNFQRLDNEIVEQVLRDAIVGYYAAVKPYAEARAKFARGAPRRIREIWPMFSQVVPRWAPELAESTPATPCSDQCCNPPS